MGIRSKFPAIKAAKGTDRGHRRSGRGPEEDTDLRQIAKVIIHSSCYSGCVAYVSFLSNICCDLKKSRVFSLQCSRCADKVVAWGLINQLLIVLGLMGVGS